MDPTPEKGISDWTSDALHTVADIGRLEIGRAQAEVRDRITAARRPLLLFAAAIVSLCLGALMLSVAAVFGLLALLPAWLAALSVGGALLLGGVSMTVLAYRRWPVVESTQTLQVTIGKKADELHAQLTGIEAELKSLISIKGQVERHPRGAVLGALGSGFLLARFFGRERTASAKVVNGKRSTNAAAGPLENED